MAWRPGPTLSSSAALPNVFLLDRQLPVQFSGLAPGFAGLWQINILVPADAPTGTDMALTAELGSSSNRLLVSVK